MNTYISELIEKIDNGDVTPGKGLIELKKIEQELKSQLYAISDEIRAIEQDAQIEIEELGGIIDGYKVQFRNGGYSYDFSDIEEVVKAKELLKELEKKYITAFQMKQKGMIPITDDGEVLAVPNAKPRKGSIIIKAVK